MGPGGSKRLRPSVTPLLRRLAVSAAILGLLTGLLVAWGKRSIGRGARWRGFGWGDDGLALVFMCEPESGIRRAFFYLAPLGKVSLEKINGGY